MPDSASAENRRTVVNTNPPTRTSRRGTVRAVVVQRFRALRATRDRGSETTEKVLWISAVLALVALLYPILSGKLQAWFNGLTFGGM
jgi:hypothetical protein